VELELNSVANGNIDSIQIKSEVVSTLSILQILVCEKLKVQLTPTEKTLFHGF